METNIFCNRNKLCNTIEHQRKTKKIIKKLMLGNSEGIHGIYTKPWKTSENRRI